MGEEDSQSKRPRGVEPHARLAVRQGSRLAPIFPDGELGAGRLGAWTEHDDRDLALAGALLVDVVAGVVVVHDPPQLVALGAL